MPAITFIEPTSTDEMAAFRELNWEYRDFLLRQPAPHDRAVTAAYPEEKFRSILDAVEVENRAPQGQMRLMLLEGRPMGCGTVQTLPSGDAEIKRVYIRPGAQGLGAGRRMMEQLIEDCRTLGHKRILMDTGRVLERAWALYDDMGFRRRGPYAEMSEDVAELLYFFEMALE